jgi:hypothetical protein
MQTIQTNQTDNSDLRGVATIDWLQKEENCYWVSFLQQIKEKKWRLKCIQPH